MSPTIRNKPWRDLQVGDTASIERRCAVQDLILFAHVSGNTNPLMLPDMPGAAHHDVVAPSMWVGSLISAVLGNVLPGPGTVSGLGGLHDDATVSHETARPLLPDSPAPGMVEFDAALCVGEQLAGGR